MINTKKGNRLNLKTPSQIYHNRKREKELPYLVSSLPDCLCLNMSHDSVLTMTLQILSDMTITVLVPLIPHWLQSSDMQVSSQPALVENGPEFLEGFTCMCKQVMNI